MAAPPKRSAPDVARDAQAERDVAYNEQFFNERAEATVVAALLVGSKLVEDIDPNLFGLQKHQYLAEQILLLRAAGHDVSLTAFADYLTEQKMLEAVGGLVYVTNLYDIHPMSTETAYAIKIVERNFYRRRAEESRKTLLTLVANWADAGEIDRALGECRYWEGLHDGIAIQVKPSHFPFVSEEDLDQITPAPAILGDILYEDTIAYLYGPSGRWKSFVALDWALSIASGRTWLGRTVKKGRVYYVAAEGSRGISKRRRAWRIHHRYTGPIDFTTIPKAVDIMDPEQVALLIGDIKARGEAPVLIVLDTLARSIPGANPNDPGVANLVTHSLAAIRDAFPGVCVLTVAHMGKDKQRGIVGAKQFFDSADTVISLDGGPENQKRIEPGEVIKLESEKPKDSDPFDDILLTAKKIEWATEAGEFVSSLVIVPSTDNTSAGQPPKLAQSSLTALVALFGASSGMRANEWMRASGIKPGTFKTWSKPDLMGRGLVIEVDGVFRLSSDGEALLRGEATSRVVPFRPA